MPQSALALKLRSACAVSLMLSSVLALEACNSGNGTTGAFINSNSSGTALAAPGAVSPVTSTREWRWERVDGQEVDTHNWTIRTSLRNSTFAASLPVFYEAALENFRGGLVPLPPPPRKLQAFVFGSRDEWARFTQQKLGSEAAAYLKMGRGGFTTEGQAVLYDIGPRDTLAIAAHEGWHQYSQTTLKSALPIWLEEGIACYMEGFRQSRDAREPTFLPWRNSERYAELRNAARRDRLASLRELLDGSPQKFLERSRDAQLAYYAQVWALVHFLREGENGKYRASLARLMDDAVHGRVADRIRESPVFTERRARESVARSRSGPGIVLVYFNTDVDEFAREYDRFVGSLLENNAWDRVMRGESPVPQGAVAEIAAPPILAAPAPPVIGAPVPPVVER